MTHKKVDSIEALQLSAKSTAEEKYAHVLQVADDHIEFYQAETSKYSTWNLLLTGTTLVFSALTPLLILIVVKEYRYRDFVVALPSAIAGLAAALNSAFRLKEEWANSYFTLCAIENERNRFILRASPEYSGDKPIAEIFDKFSNRMGLLVMSEVLSWQRSMFGTEKSPQRKIEIDGPETA